MQQSILFVALSALTQPQTMPIVQCMREPNLIVKELSEINARVDRLLELCQRLGAENRSLRQSQEQLATERANLLAKNEQARSRVEAMIHRLKSLEQNG